MSLHTERAKELCTSLAEEASSHLRTMQAVITSLSDEELTVLEKVTQQCRLAHTSDFKPDMVTFVLDWEQHFV